MFVKVAMQGSSSVFVAEAAALALAATLLNVMGFIPANLFSENQLLVNCINGSDPPNTPDWRAVPYTQIGSSTLAGSFKVHKISRDQNQMADSLARQGLAYLQSNQLI
jgi:ribonuclease HI